jgi:cellulose synthase/poly-beta-1,6-N-acetylglucosamine synthase-like glycosyltransferase
MPQLAAAVVLALAFVDVAGRPLGEGLGAPRSAGWWIVTLLLHLPFALIVAFVLGGLVERVGYFWRGRRPRAPGRLPVSWPSVCVQLPMFNEGTVAQRVIEAAARMTWPSDRLEVQVLDDSTDPAARAVVEAACARVRSMGVRCSVLHRADRSGYKAGALEAGRRATSAEFLAIFDADFLPPPDFLVRAMPHFFRSDGTPDGGLALVQAQWGHLNHDESALTRAQSLWVDDHHTLQMSWRAAMWDFVNFTGTAGIWRAAAVETVGGWHGASLVEDCELSFRHLFAGYRTTFVKEIVAPAELPATYTAYKAQQKRWTQGWAQLQKLHLSTLLRRYRCSSAKRLHLLYHMCISWQWPAWAVWIALLPFLIHTGHWFGSFGAGTGVAVYLLPTILWITVSATLASVETRHTYTEPASPSVLARRLHRVVPYLLLNTGMLPHQLSAFAEGMFGPLHSEFERTPKSATVTGAGPPVPAVSGTPAAPVADGAGRVRVHWPYVLTELAFVAYQAAWAVQFIGVGLLWCAAGAVYLGACVLGLAYRYGDDAGRVCLVVRRRPRQAAAPRAAPPPVVDLTPAALPLPRRQPSLASVD